MNKDTLAPMLKNYKKWLTIKPKYSLMGRESYSADATYKSMILSALSPNIIKDNEDYAPVISALSKILKHFIAKFPQGITISQIPDYTKLQADLKPNLSVPNTVTIESFILARLKYNLKNGINIFNDINSRNLGSFNASKLSIDLNAVLLQDHINSTIVDNGKFNYRTDEDYVNAEIEHVFIHELLHAISNSDKNVGFRSKGTGANRGVNEATTEHIAATISNPANYRHKINHIFKTRKIKFLSCAPSTSGYSRAGIVNLLNLLNDNPSRSSTVTESYILGINPPTSIFSSEILDNINNIYGFSNERDNLIKQCNTYYGISNTAFYEAQNITSASVPVSTKIINVIYVDQLNKSHTIPVKCETFSNGIYRYSPTNTNTLYNDAVKNTFTASNINDTSYTEGTKALTNLICSNLNTSNTPPTTSPITINHLEVLEQRDFMHYTLTTKAQDSIVEKLLTDIESKVTSLTTTFDKAIFDATLDKLDLIADNLVYAIPNDVATYNIKNVGFVDKIIKRNSSVPLETLKKYKALRSTLLSIGRLNATKLNAGLSNNTIISIDGIDIVIEKDASNVYHISKSNPKGNISALYAKLKKYPNINANPNLSEAFLHSTVEDIINNCIMFNPLDEFYNNYNNHRINISSSTIGTYLNDEKYKSANVFTTNSIFCEYNGKSITKEIIVKYTNHNRDRLFLQDTTLKEIQAVLNTPYTLKELNAIISNRLGNQISNLASIDFVLGCNIGDIVTNKLLSSNEKELYVNIGNTTHKVKVPVLDGVCIIGNNTPKTLEGEIIKVLSNSKYKATFDKLPNKNSIVETIRLGLNKYIHETNQNDLLRNSTKTNPYKLNMEAFIDYSISHDIKLSNILTTSNPTQNRTPIGNNSSGKNSKTPIAPYKYFNNYINNNGQFTFNNFNFNQSYNPNYYYQLFNYYQYMQYFGYMMNYFGGFNNYPMIQSMNMGNMSYPGGIMYMPMNNQYAIPYFYNGNNYTNNIANMGASIPATQVSTINGMVNNTPINTNNVSTVDLVKQIKELQDKLTKLEKAYAEKMKNGSTMDNSITR